MIGRRLPSPTDGEPPLADFRPGDYCGPFTDRAGNEVCWFLLPVAGDYDVDPGLRSFHHVAFPPHTYRECADGSLEIRASILAGGFGTASWHGYLDEGHHWREC